MKHTYTFLAEHIVVLDTDVPYELENKFFDHTVVKDNRFLWPWGHLYEEALKRGIQFITPDIFFSLPKKPRNAVFVSAHMIGKYTFPLIRAGVHPAVVFGFENPLFACTFYFNLKKYTSLFDHAYVYGGAKSRLASGVVFHDAAYHPHAYEPLHVTADDFLSRKLLVMINRNNRLHILRKLYVTAMNYRKPLSSLSKRDLYLDRLRAVDYFAKYSTIDLYGSGWDQPVRYTFGKYEESIRRAYRGYVSDKQTTLKQYRFSLCFENAIFNGFVTEKIIDSLFAGCIPVYYGAPDILTYVPKGTFIDFRNFRNYAKLDTYLRTMDMREYMHYIYNINQFIDSEQQRLFTQEYFAEELIDILGSYFI